MNLTPLNLHEDVATSKTSYFLSSLNTCEEEVALQKEFCFLVFADHFNEILKVILLKCNQWRRRELLVLEESSRRLW